MLVDNHPCFRDRMSLEILMEQLIDDLAHISLFHDRPDTHELLEIWIDPADGHSHQAARSYTARFTARALAHAIETGTPLPIIWRFALSVNGDSSSRSL